MPKEIYPSSYLCDCGYQSDFCENTVTELKQASMRRPQRLGSDDGKHVVVFNGGKMTAMWCPNVGEEIPSANASRMARAAASGGSEMKRKRAVSRGKVVYKSKDEVVARFMHPKAKEFVHYASVITIMDAGENPVSIHLKFDGILPFIAPMPPEEHTIGAPTVVELFRKLERWLRKHGYTFHPH